MLYLFFTKLRLGSPFFKIISTSGDPIVKILLFDSPICKSLCLAILFVTKCRCDNFDIECLIISSTVPDISPPSICATFILFKHPVIAPAKDSTLSPWTTIKSVLLLEINLFIPLIVLAKVISMLIFFDWLLNL